MLNGLVLLLTRVLSVEAENALKVTWNFSLASEHRRLLQSLPKPLHHSVIEGILPSWRAEKVRASIGLALQNGISFGLGEVIFIIADSNRTALRLPQLDA